MTNETPQKPLSIEQAGNYLKEKTKTMAADLKKEVKNKPVSLAPPEDRKKFLIYGMSLLVDVTESEKSTFCIITKKTPVLYTTKDVARILRQILALGINGCTIRQMAHHLKEEVSTMEKVDEFAKFAAMGAIKKKKIQIGSIPLIGR